MKKIKKEYYLIAVLFICFGLLTLFVTSGKALVLDEVFYNGLIKIKNS